ncbi:MAG: SurA N-terminal domain-containing protein [Verrucomicrobiales bacterium]
MKAPRFAFPALTILALAALAHPPVWAQGAAGPAVASQNSVAAIVNGKVITRNEVEAAAKYQLFILRRGVSEAMGLKEKEQEALRKGLNELIDRELMISEFERMGATIKPQYVEEDIQRIIRENYKGDREQFLGELKRSGMTWARFREQHRKTLVVAAMRGQATKNVSFATPQQKEDYFRRNQDEFREEGAVWMRTLAIEQVTGEPDIPLEEQRARQRRIANEIRTRLVQGADFTALARSYSKDSKASVGGDWGILQRSELAPQLADVAFSIPVKTISDVFEFRGYYYIMMVEERRPGKLKPQTEIDELLDRLVQAEMKKKAMDEYLAKLRKKATLVFPDPSLRPAPRAEPVYDPQAVGASR